ncbi:MAG: squalene/phytoene synthase family protein [Thalassobaculaceae bacterium]
MVAKKANANFFYASQILNTPRREFFYATYAAMRIIDDVIDEDFLKLDAKGRNKLEASFEIRLEGSRCVTGNGY